MPISYDVANAIEGDGITARILELAADTIKILPQCLLAAPLVRDNRR